MAENFIVVVQHVPAMAVSRHYTSATNIACHFATDLSIFSLSLQWCFFNFESEAGAWSTNTIGLTKCTTTAEKLTSQHRLSQASLLSPKDCKLFLLRTTYSTRSSLHRKVELFDLQKLHLRHCHVCQNER